MDNMDQGITLAEMLAAVARVEEKLDVLIAAIAEEDEPEFTLDGDFAGRQRDEGQPL